MLPRSNVIRSRMEGSSKKNETMGLIEKTVYLADTITEFPPMPKELRNQAIMLALRLTMSPHEWTWTKSEIEKMAKYVIWSAQRLAIIENMVAGGPLKHKEDEV
jgi:hypothetical protein